MLQVPLRRRFYLLFALLGLSLVGLLVLMQYLEGFEKRDIVSAECDRKGALLENWMLLKGESLKQFAFDYTQWDEMGAFVKNPTREWGGVNIDASLPNFQTQGAWACLEDGTPVYQAFHPADRELMSPPFHDARFMALLRQKMFLHFFSNEAGTLVEYRLAPIQDSGDAERKGSPKGWFAVARVWGGREFNSLASLTESQVSVLAPDQKRSISGADMQWTRSLSGWDGRPVAVLLMTFSSSGILVGLAHDRVQLLVFSVFGLFGLALSIYFIRTWVLYPIGRIGDALARGSSLPLADVLGDSGEIGQLARLVEDSFAQHQALEKEVQERQRVELALRQSESSLRQSLRTRVELGRNLHDGVIQSLYASGMAMATATSLVKTNPDEAIRSLEETRGLLNEVIHDVRDFIIGLEPERLASLSFSEALRKVFDQMSNLRACEFSMEVPEDLVQRLSAPVRIQLLQISREAISNSLRHGEASRLDCRLSPREGGLLFELLDNGSGFNFEPGAANPGFGLKNLVQRAKEFGADLSVDSAKGRGTDLRLFIPLEQRL